MAPVTTLKGIDNVGEFTNSEIILHSLNAYFEWGFLDKGGFFNVRLNDTGPNGEDYSRLRPVVEKGFTNGQVWEGFQNQWVWQSGVSYSSQPIQVSGVHVNGVYYPLSTSGTYSHTVNYPEGRIVFNSAISTSATVRVEHTHPWLHVTSVDNLPWLNNVQTYGLRSDSPQFLQAGSGAWESLARSRVQLPTIAIELANTTFHPYELGGSSKYTRPLILVHVVAENKQECRRIADIIGNQWEKTIYTYDLNRMAQQNRFPLNYLGMITSGALSYPQLVVPVEDGGFLYRKFSFIDAEIERVQSINTSIHTCTVRFKGELISGNI